MEIFQGKIPDLVDPLSRLSRLWKGLKDILKAPSDEALEVLKDKFATLFEEVILSLSQASLLVSYTRRINILKMITKDPRKAKSMLKENENILKESETRLFGKKLRSHMIEIEKSRKKSLEAFKDVGEKNLPSEKAHCTIKINRTAEGAITMRGNQVMETNTTTVNSKVRFNVITERNFNIEVQQHRLNTTQG